jgi:hypothetical protein
MNDTFLGNLGVSTMGPLRVDVLRRAFSVARIETKEPYHRHPNLADSREG